jgi:hypothetical protein
MDSCIVHGGNIMAATDPVIPSPTIDDVNAMLATNELARLQVENIALKRMLAEALAGQTQTNGKIKDVLPSVQQPAKS